MLLGRMEQRPRIVRDNVYTCVVLYNMQRTQLGGTDRAPNPGNDGAALQNNQACVPNKNYRNPSREVKHQRELVKDYFTIMGGTDWAGRQDLRCLDQQF